MSLPPISRAARRGAAVAETIDAYEEWRRQCVTVDQAYRRWSEADRVTRRLAFWLYRSALDAEERAARVYARHAQQTGGAPHVR